MCNLVADTANSTSQIFKDCGIRDVAKLTHHRSAALQLGGFKGLSESENNALTDHKLDKHHSAYGPVCVAKTCKVMAGFDIDDAYFVPRSMIELPHSVQWYVRKLLPRYDAWKAEATSSRGDKSTFCAMFLDDLLPWLVEVLVQDGCYFVDDFPEHVIAKLLRMCIPGYDRFALHSRRWVTEKQNSRQLDQIVALGGASKASYEALQRQIDKLHTTNDRLQDRVQFLESKLDDSTQLFERKMNELIAAVTGKGVQEQESAVQERHEPPLPPEDTRNTANQPPTINDTLIYPPRQAPFESALPKSLDLLWREWQCKGLEQYRRQDKGRLGWPKSIRVGYERRLYLVDKILERAERLSITVPEAARRMDGSSRAGIHNNEENRNGLSVYQFWKHLHDTDTTIHRRGIRRQQQQQQQEGPRQKRSRM